MKLPLFVDKTLYVENPKEPSDIRRRGFARCVDTDQCSKSPTYETSSCELPKMRTCVHMSNHVSQFTCLAYIVPCVHPVQVVVLLCTLLYSTVQSTVVRYLYFTPRTQMQNGTQRLQQPFRMQSSATVSSMTRKKELPPRHHWIIFSRGQIELNLAMNQNLGHQHQA